jgi:hypothetical protein
MMGRNSVDEPNRGGIKRRKRRKRDLNSKLKQKIKLQLSKNPGNPSFYPFSSSCFSLRSFSYPLSLHLLEGLTTGLVGLFGFKDKKTAR